MSTTSTATATTCTATSTSTVTTTTVTTTTSNSKPPPYGEEVLGKQVDIAFIVAPEEPDQLQFYRGIIRKMEVTLLLDNKTSQIAHYVYFPDGDEIWVDLVEYEQLDKLRWPTHNNSDDVDSIDTQHDKLELLGDFLDDVGEKRIKQEEDDDEDEENKEEDLAEAGDFFVDMKKSIIKQEDIKRENDQADEYDTVDIKEEITNHYKGEEKKEEDPAEKYDAIGDITQEIAKHGDEKTEGDKAEEGEILDDVKELIMREKRDEEKEKEYRPKEYEEPDHIMKGGEEEEELKEKRHAEEDYAVNDYSVEERGDDSTDDEELTDDDDDEEWSELPKPNRRPKRKRMQKQRKHTLQQRISDDQPPATPETETQPVPICHTHGLPCKLVVSGNERDKGRRFYRCSLDFNTRCHHFVWEDEVGLPDGDNPIAEPIKKQKLEKTIVMTPAMLTKMKEVFARQREQEGDEIDIEGFEYWIRYIFKNSKGEPHKQWQQERTQVRRLATGEGIKCNHWPEGMYFRRGIRHTMNTDFDLLRDEAKEFCAVHGGLSIFGRLLKQPIERLQLYAEYINAGRADMEGV